MPQSYDWEYYRHKYVTGGEDITLEHLATLPNSPHLGTIKDHCRKEDWKGQRQAYHDQLKTKTLEMASTTEAEVSARHARIARSMLSKAVARLEQINVDELNATEVRFYIKDAAEIERKALGMEVARVDVSHVVKPAEPSREVLELLKEELERQLN